MALSWTPSGGPVTAYQIEAGSVAGLSNLAALPTGNSATSLHATAPPGVYYVRVRGQNACGTGPPSNEIVVKIP